MAATFAATSDVIFTPRGRLEARQAFYADVKARLPRRLPGPNLHDHLGLRHTRKETA